MPAASNRAPLLLAVIVILGVGGRFLRERWEGGEAAPAQQEALDRQLARVERASQAARSRPKRGEQVASRAATPRARPSTRSAQSRKPSSEPLPDGVRREQTPLGAIPPSALNRYLAATGRSVGTGPDGSQTVQPVDRQASRRATPQPSASLIDVESASATELERLPRIGPALAGRIVQDRERHGPFRSLEGLQRVRGVGPATARQLEGRVTFGGGGRP